MKSDPKPPEATPLPGGVTLDQIPPQVFASLRSGEPARAILHLVRRHPMSLADATDCIRAITASLPPPSLPPQHQSRPRSRKTT